MAPKDDRGSGGEEDRSDEPSSAESLLKLSALGDGLRRATEAGSGVLSVGRPWVRHEGWLLKEGGLTSSYQPRFFVVVGGKLEYYKEESCKLNLKNAAETPLGLTLATSNVVLKVEPGLAHQQKALLEGDVIIGLNGDTLVHQPLQPAVKKARDSGMLSLTFTVLRPKGKVHLAGASIVLGGARKSGGHIFTINNADRHASRSRYSLVSASERECLAWQTSIKEAIAAAAMEAIKVTILQALEEQNLADKNLLEKCESLRHGESSRPPSARAAPLASPPEPAEAAEARRLSTAPLGHASDRTVAVL